MTTLTAQIGGNPTPKARKTYPQDWPSYNQAQAHELRAFYRLNADLCRTIPDELSLQQPRGRHRIPLADLAQVAVLKAYLGFPGRLLGSPNEDESVVLQLHEAGLISRPMCWNSVGNFLRDDRMSLVLQYLVETSALPLVPIERGEISTDSTIIDGSVRVKKGERHYRGQRQHRIVKLHVAIGNLSNVVTACAIEGPGAGEAPILPGLLFQTAKAFPVKNVYGDSAYTSVQSYEIVNRMGARGWFDFKGSHTGDAGGVFGEMYHWAMAHQAEFKAKYHVRSNVEATFSAIKRVLANGIRQKTATLRNKQDVSLKNELYSIIVAHNLRVVIKHIYKVGIAPNFLPIDAGSLDPLNPH